MQSWRLGSPEAMGTGAVLGPRPQEGDNPDRLPQEALSELSASLSVWWPDTKVWVSLKQPCHRPSRAGLEEQSRYCKRTPSMLCAPLAPRRGRHLSNSCSPGFPPKDSLQTTLLCINPSVLPHVPDHLAQTVQSQSSQLHIYELLGNHS